MLLTLTMGPLLALGVAGVAPGAAAQALARVAGQHQAGTTHPGARHAAAPHVPALAGIGKDTPFCKGLGKKYEASSGAQMYCFGAQLTRGGNGKRAQVSQAQGAPPNVDAATVSEDVNPAGVPGQGQSEVSIGAAGHYVAEAWNDATSFLSNCGAAGFKEEGTGLGFSTDGGKTFTDLGGLPNLDCTKYLYEGDPSVAAYRVGGHTYFYVSSLYDPVNGEGRTDIALDACSVEGSGATATLRCGQPVVAARSSQCEIFKERISKHKTRTVRFCSFADKDYLTIDPAHGRLYVTYSDFLLTGNGGDPEAMSACDIGTRAGGSGPAGGTPAAPACKRGTPMVKVSSHLQQAKPYLTVAPADPRGCFNEGSYPAADTATGNVYVGYESNWDSLAFPPCENASTPTQNVLTKTTLHCLRLAKTAACGPSRTVSAPVTSLSSVLVPGYNRFPGNDFPRLAVSDKAGTVTMVWNDTRFHPFGDILMQSFSRGTLRPVQARPVRLDQPHNGGLSMFPALRTATASGLLDVSWYSRSSATTADTGVEAAMDVSPLATVTPPNVQLTSALSNWDNDSSLIVPNFGDYTDSAVSVTGSAPYLGNTWYVAWSDGRLGIPQPFEAHLPAG
jgi:hypothetical protein